MLIQHDPTRRRICTPQQTLGLIVTARGDVTRLRFRKLNLRQWPKSDLTARRIETLMVTRGKVRFPTAALQPANRQ